MKRYKNIDILKSILLFSIILLHVFSPSYLGANKDISIYNWGVLHTQNGYLAVEGFFIIAGFLLFKNLNNKISVKMFVKNKLIRFFPLLIIVIFLYFILSLFKLGDFTLKNNVLTLLFLNFSGANSNSGHLWFISVYFWCSVIYFLIGKNIKTNHLNIHIVLILTSIILINFIGLNNFLRGFLGFGIGSLIAYCDTYFTHKRTLHKFYKYVEIALFSFLLYCLFFCTSSINYFLFIAVFAVFLLLNVNTQIPLCRNVSTPTNTYSIYVFHIPILTLFKKSIWTLYPDINPFYNCVLLLLTIYLTGYLIYKYIEQPIINFKNK